MRDIRRVIVIFVGQDFLRVVEDVGAGLAVVQVWWRDPFAASLSARFLVTGTAVYGCGVGAGRRAAC